MRQTPPTSSNCGPKNETKQNENDGLIALLSFSWYPCKKKLFCSPCVLGFWVGNFNIHVVRKILLLKKAKWYEFSLDKKVEFKKSFKLYHKILRKVLTMSIFNYKLKSTFFWQYVLLHTDISSADILSKVTLTIAMLV